MSDDEKIVSLHSAAPSAHLKRLEFSDARARCRHKKVLVWPREPILECRDCGIVVDAHQWIRDRARDWDALVSALDYERNKIKGEISDLKKGLRLLRREYKDEAEKRAAERQVAVLPPRRRASE